MPYIVQVSKLRLQGQVVGHRLRSVLSEDSRVLPVTGHTAPYWSAGLIAMTFLLLLHPGWKELQTKNNSCYKDTVVGPLPQNSSSK